MESAPLEVAYVEEHSMAALRALPQPQLRVMWDADSVPFLNNVLEAFLQEVGNGQVRRPPTLNHKHFTGLGARKCWAAASNLACSLLRRV